MNKELSKDLMCVSMRNGVEVWLEAERATTLREALLKVSKSKFVNIDEQIINTADVVGIFNPETMSDHTRRRNGEWRCKYNEWHEKFQKCDCGAMKRYEGSGETQP